MPYVTKEQIAKAKELDLLTYLQHCEPEELVRVSADTYCTRSHDSLKISNGKWHWFSHNIGGKTALDYLIKVKGFGFVQAVECLSGQASTRPCVPAEPKETNRPELVLPESNENMCTVISYLRGRGIALEVINYCIENRLLYEAKDYHNAVFLGYDREGKLRYGSLRGTRGLYKGELSGSNKRYSFSITGSSKTVHVFESAIDLMSYASFLIHYGRNWREDSLLSLAGVFKTKRLDVVPVALEQFLADHPEVGILRLHLDNDEIGRAAAACIIAGLKDRYELHDAPPLFGKDVNDQLVMTATRREDAR